MAVQPLSPAIDRRLGGPLHRQLTNQTRVHLIAMNLFPLYHAVLWAYAVLAIVSNCCPPPIGIFPRVTHQCAALIINSKLSIIPAQLACVKPAASVRSEPGSNSHVN